MTFVAKVLVRIVWSLIDAIGLWLGFYLFDMFPEMKFQHWWVMSVALHSMAKSVTLRNTMEMNLFGRDTIIATPQTDATQG